jgi:hypothetical protein
MSPGQIFKKRPAGGNDKNDATEYGNLNDQLPNVNKAEDSVRAAREAARIALERRIKEKREQKQKEEKVCPCW